MKLITMQELLFSKVNDARVITYPSSDFKGYIYLRINAFNGGGIEQIGEGYEKALFSFCNAFYKTTNPFLGVHFENLIREVNAELNHKFGCLVTRGFIKDISNMWRDDHYLTGVYQALLDVTTMDELLELEKQFRSSVGFGAEDEQMELVRFKTLRKAVNDWLLEYMKEELRLVSEGAESSKLTDEIVNGKINDLLLLTSDKYYQTLRDEEEFNVVIKIKQALKDVVEVSNLNYGILCGRLQGYGCDHS